MRGGTPVALSVIALFEMRYGFAKGNRREHNESLLERFLGLGIDLLPFEPEDAMHAGDIRAELERGGSPIGHYDYLIAAQARRRGATLGDSEPSRVLARAGVVGCGLGGVMDAAVPARRDDATDEPTWRRRLARGRK